MSSNEQQRVTLTGVPETMLWTLHNRATEAQRKDGILRDPDAIRIYESIDYDFEKNFGPGDGTHAMRSRVFDDALRPWLRTHSGGTVVELAAGLETQFQRCDDGKVQWLCVDVPEAIDVRARFLPEVPRCRHLRTSALDLSWMDSISTDTPVFVTAQGLFMYFRENEVRALVTAILDRFTHVDLMFDTIPPWFSRKTMKGFAKTASYETPPMPWGIKASMVEREIAKWHPAITSVERVHYGYLRGFMGKALPIFARLPLLEDLVPTVARVRTAA